MANESPESRDTLDIRKYPNRRYYDASHSVHVTLEDIHQLIREGHDVAVTDSRTGQDITGKVLTQILMDQDPFKLGVFPNALLHALIRSNEQLVTDFVDKYFNGALEAFLDSQKQFELYLRHVVGLRPDDAGGGGAVNPNPFATGFMSPFLKPFMPPMGAAGPGPRASEDGDSEAAELRAMVEELQRQVARLAEQGDGGTRP